MPQYKVHIHDRSYTQWTFYYANNLEEVELPEVHPAACKMMTNDIFTLENGKVTIIHSSIRTDVPAVLILQDQKTYGRVKMATGKPGKLLYKCIPDDRRLPVFLVPYEMKQMGFSKVFANVYVTIHLVEWKDKHPLGHISQWIGPVDVLDNFYEYQLYCKSLNASIQKFTKETSKALAQAPHDAFIETICQKYPSIQDRTGPEWTVVTIDPPKSQDFDDGFGIRHLELESGRQTILSIYIANVTIWLDVLKLWDSFSRRISTIYLPDRKRPMLPTILSDCLCSLQAGCTRFAFVMDIYLNEEREIQNIQYVNCKIRVAKNYCYEDSDLLKSGIYHQLLELGHSLSSRYKYIQHVGNSHELVMYFMIFMNYHCAKELLKHRQGVFRMAILKRENVFVPDHLPTEVQNFIQIWNSTAGQYLDISTLAEGATFSHDILNMEAYVHITSPIRRIVDLLNILQFQQSTGLLALSDSAMQFYAKWLSELDYINTTIRAIRRVQNDCSLLNYCTETPGVMDKTYQGYAFDKIIRNDGLYQYIVYLPELKLASRIIARENLENYEMRAYKLFLFHNEEKFKKKIRLQLAQLT